MRKNEAWSIYTQVRRHFPDRTIPGDFEGTEWFQDPGGRWRRLNGDKEMVVLANGVNVIDHASKRVAFYSTYNGGLLTLNHG